MSRGPGKIQQAILEAIKEDDIPTQRNKLLWKLATENDRVVMTGKLCEGISKGNIDPSLEKAFQRSLKRLTETNQVKIRKQKLRNIDEFIAYYPFKTSYLDIFQLRTRLLPHIKSFLEGRYHRIPFTIRDNEIYILDKLESEHPKKVDSYAARWQRIERKILKVLPSLKRSARSRWIKVIIKGQELFIDDKARYRLSFHKIVNNIEEKMERLSQEEIELLAEVQAFMRKPFPPQLMKHSRFKSEIYAVGDFNERTTPKLKDGIKMYFLDQEPELVKALPEHYQPDTKVQFGMHYKPSFSPILDSLIDRHTFSKFQFLLI